MGLDISSRNHAFRAGSYSGFNAFREWLAEKVGYKGYTDLLAATEEAAGEWVDNRGQAKNASKAVTAGALFHHSDCDGFITTTDAKLLHKDLVAIRDKLPPLSLNDMAEDAEQERWNREKLNDWIAITEDVSRGGDIINFH